MRMVCGLCHGGTRVRQHAFLDGDGDAGQATVPSACPRCDGNGWRDWDTGEPLIEDTED